MASVCEQITAQMDEVAALISDPKILLTQPELIVKGFASAIKKVEMLQTYLAKKRVGEGIDASVLTGGVQAMVNLTMEKLMYPFKNKLPSIVVNEFHTNLLSKFPDLQVYTKYTAELGTFSTREIKETNCLAAVVLVYYYLFWHTCLIKINQNFFSVYDENIEKDIKKMLTSLPQDVNMTEFRYTSPLFVGSDKSCDDLWGHLKKSNVRLPVMPANEGKNDYYCAKQTRASTMYQMLLAETLGKLQKTMVKRTREFSDTAGELQTDYVYRTAKLFGGVFSTLHLHDERDIWNEMKTVTEVICPNQLQDQQVRLSSSLHRILKSPPYSLNEGEFYDNAYGLCVYHYTVLPLMIGICKHTKMLFECTQYTRLDDFIAILAPLSRDPTNMQKATNELLETSMDSDKVKTGFDSFIQDTPNHARVGKNNIPLNNMTVADIRGYYLCRGLITMEKSNHLFISAPSSMPVLTSNFYPKLRHVLKEKQSSLTNWGTYVAPFVQNSFQVTLEARSISLLFSKLKTTEAAKDIRPLITAILEKATHMESQYRAVLERHSKAGRGRYHKYAGVSWPVHYVNNLTKSDNYEKFDEEGVVPRVLKGTMVELSEHTADIADAAKAFLDMGKDAVAARQGGFTSTSSSPAGGGRRRVGGTGLEGIVPEGGNEADTGGVRTA